MVTIKNNLGKIILVNLFLIFNFTSFGQKSNQTTYDVIAPGFYMNSGCTKVDSITCYGFDDTGFRLVHELTKEMFVYDKIVYTCWVGVEKLDIAENFFRAEIDGKVFNSVLEGISSISVKLKLDNDNFEYTRNKRTITGSNYTVIIEGYMLKGYEEKWDEYSKSFIRKPIYDKTEIIKEIIPLRNRKRLKESPLYYVPIIGYFVNRKPKPLAVLSSDCLPCVGLKPNLFEFDPWKY